MQLAFSKKLRTCSAVSPRAGTPPPAVAPTAPLLCTTALLLAGCGSGAGPSAVDSTSGSAPVTVEFPASARAEFERVVLVTIDTLRADHVSCYGYPRLTTPFVDSLAARGVRFTRGFAAVSHTAPSHASMLTGLVPAVHGVLQNGGSLAPEVTDLAEVFRDRGFETAAFLNVEFLSGIASSFQTVEVRAVTPDRHLLTGADVVDAALAWSVEKRASPRFLLWVHLYDPHRWKETVLQNQGSQALWTGPTPEGFLARVAELHGLPAPRAGEPYVVDWVVEKRSGKPLDFGSAEAFLRCIDAYDALTLFTDRQIERLYRGLEALALPGRTLWVVTSDHGEGLASHRVAGHGGVIYQEQLHVPLVLHVSDGSLSARVVEELVTHVDLFPTLAESLGARVGGAEPLYEGRSLWPLARGTAGAPGPRTIFSQRRPGEDDRDPDQAEIYALQDSRHKLILHRPGKSQLFDLAQDPQEQRDLGGEQGAAAELRSALEARLDAYSALPPRAGAPVPEEWLRELRELGYAR